MTSTVVDRRRALVWICLVVLATLATADEPRAPQSRPRAPIDHADPGVDAVPTAAPSSTTNQIPKTSVGPRSNLPPKANADPQTSLAPKIEAASAADPAATTDPIPNAASVAAGDAPSLSAPVLATDHSSEVDRLRALAAGELSGEVEVRSLFALRLTDPEAVKRRQLALDTQRAEIERSIQAIAKEVAELQSAAAQPSPPPPGPPPPPTLEDPGPPPSAPERPAFADKRRLTRAQRREMATYREALARHHQDLALHQERRRANDNALEAHRQTLEEHQRVAAAVAKEHQERQVRAAARLTEIEAEREKLTTSLSAVEMRSAYLGRLGTMLDSMPPAALKALDNLDEPRAALQRLAAQVLVLADTLTGLEARLQTLAARAETGSLVGFLVDRDQLRGRLRDTQAQLDRTRAATSQFAAELGVIAAQEEEEGRALQDAVLRAAATPDSHIAIDRLFQAHIHEVRRLRRSAVQNLSGLSIADIETANSRIAAALPEPAQVGTYTDAQRESERLAALIAETELVATRGRAAQRSWALAFERQIISALEPLASAQSRSAAYALTATYIFDLKDDLLELTGRLQAWGAVRFRELWQLLTFSDSGASWGWLFRITLALLVAIAYVNLRGRVPALVTGLVRWVSRRSSAGARLGSLVRWVGLLQAVLPALALVTAAYLVLAVLGFVHPEVQIAEVLLRYSALYLLGRVTLVGLTRRISRGRPALIPASDETVARLRLTYDRVGLVILFTLGTGELASRWLGMGRLRSVIDLVLLGGLLAWALWACLAWRQVLAAWLVQTAGIGSRLGRVGVAMEAKRRGFVLSPLVLLGLAGFYGYHLARRLVLREWVSTYLRARELKRLASKGAVEEARSAELDPEYLEAFPLHGTGADGAVVLQREDITAPLLEQITRWRGSRAEGSVVLVGEKGVGKSTLIALLRRQVGDLPVVEHALVDKRLSEIQLVEDLAPAIHGAVLPDLASLARQLNAGPERIVFLDDAHNTFLRTVDGYLGFDALIRLVNATAERIFWVLAFNSFAWEFINTSRHREHYFRRLVPLRRWSADEIQDLIGLRNRRSGFSVVFDELLLDDETGSAGHFQLIEGADGFFRLLWESSRGNPRAAIALWLSALTPVDKKRIMVGLFRTPDVASIDRLGDELVYALASLTQHENLSAPELALTLNVTDDFAAFALRLLREHDLVEPKAGAPERMTLAPRTYPQVLAVLRRRHLLFEAP